MERAMVATLNLFYLLLAALIAVTRVVLGDHDASDVTAGAALGMLLALLVC
jgi:membrane-associated phospholipid phosphatase